MNNKEIYDFKEQIKSLTKELIESTDFKRLNHDISSTVNGALEEARKQLKNTSNKYVQHKPVQAPNIKNSPIQKVKIKPVGRVAGTLCIVFGGIGIGITGVALIVLFILGVVVGLLEGIMMPIFWGVVVLFTLFCAMLGRGTSLLKRLNRLKRYTSLVNDKIYCSTKELAETIGKTGKFVIKDLRQMLGEGMLPEAYLDEKENRLVLDKVQYKMYLEEQNAIISRKAQEDMREKQNASRKMSPLMKEGLAYVKVLREVNEEIPGEIISAKLTRLENVILKILDSVERNPKHGNDMQRFMAYYLPTTVKLVNAYAEFERVDSQGENITTAKKEIEATLDTISEAFEHFLDQLYQEATIDVTTDAEVLQSMLAREGWTEKDFK